ncbi:MAG: SurA N-terminal domain-containing protein [Hyphomicrobiaceae bacterium]
MLDTLRRGAGSWLAKGLLFLLIISFGVWGVADVFRGQGASTVARVGDSDISSAEFQQAYQNQLEEIRRRFGSRITAEQARAFGLDRQVLSRLIGAAVIDQHVRSLDLALPDSVIADIVRRDPVFLGPDGQFSRRALESILREAGYSEKSYLASRRRDEVREHLTQALATPAAPQPLVELLYKHREETRTVSYFTIDAAKVAIGTPDDAKLKETYEANKARFVVPEQRKIAALILTIDELAKSITIPEADVRAAYEQGKELYAIAEQRRIEQISFPDRAAAEAQRKKIAAGQSFADAAKDAGAKPTDIDLGLLTQKQVIDPAIAEAAFALAKNQVSAVIEGKFATVLLRVPEIQPGRQKPFEEVRTEIRDRLAHDKDAEEIQKLHDQIDDQRAAGKPLAEIGAAMKVRFVEVAALDRSGTGPDGKPAIADADAQRIAAAAFEAQVGGDSDAIEIGDAGYAWVSVLAVTPERQKAQDEVAADVKTAWIEQERRRLVTELADKLAERAQAGEPLAALAKEAGGKVETAKDVKRAGGRSGLPDAAIVRVFATPKGKATSADSGTTRVVLKVDEINVPATPTADALRPIAEEIERQMQNDVLAAYVSALQDRFGVRINDAALRQSIGPTQQQ